MVEPLFLFETKSQPVAGELIEIAGAEAKHAISVRRIRVAEKVQLSNGAGLRVRGVVESTLNATLQIRALEVFQESRNAIRIGLVQALAKGDRDEMAVQACTEIGLTDIYPWQAKRSISIWNDAKAEKSRLRWQAIATEAAKQSLQSFVPEVHSVLPSIEVAALFADYDRVIVLDPASEIAFSNAVPAGVGSVLLVIGPEGGISDDELVLFENSGAARVSLGTNILRTSTAGPVALSLVRFIAGEYN
jgi:16S rRNA (uracil1498-N3)-methyltransferase